MKVKALIAALFVAGLAASFALADGGTPGGTTTTTTGGAPKCQKVELKGSNASGSVSFTVVKANKKGSDLVGKSATLTVPAGASVSATACRDAAGNLTLHGLEVKVGDKGEHAEDGGKHEKKDK